MLDGSAYPKCWLRPSVIMFLPALISRSHVVLNLAQFPLLRWRTDGAALRTDLRPSKLVHHENIATIEISESADDLCVGCWNISGKIRNKTLNIVKLLNKNVQSNSPFDRIVRGNRACTKENRWYLFKK